MLKVYFAGSINGGTFERQAETYQAIIQTIKENAELVSLHEAVTGIHNSHLAPWQVHDRDIAWLNEANMLIAEVSAPSTGVGYEIGYARFIRRIPVLCLRQAYTRPSFLIDGNVYILNYTYTAIHEAQLATKQFIEGTLKLLPPPY